VFVVHRESAVCHWAVCNSVLQTAEWNMMVRSNKPANVYPKRLSWGLLLSDVTHLLYAQNFSREGRQCSSRCYSSLPKVGVHAIWFSVLQLKLGSYWPYLKVVL
jgi:hypothetical protein